MWQIVAQSISDVIGETFAIEERNIVSGGDINQAYCIANNRHQFFVKVNDLSHLIHFECEAYSLAQIQTTNQIDCPEVVCLGKTKEFSFLVMDYLELSNSHHNDWLTLGRQLAKLHKTTTHGQFGWQADNYIGHTRQPNKWQSNWKSFFSEQRIGWQLQLLHEKSLRFGNIDHIVELCHQGLVNHKVSPSLVHGDLWQGNLGFTEYGGVMFDPACYYGDREVDIAMTELFGNLPTSFYQGYQEEFPLSQGYEQRKTIYNFYHILNHANLFGGVYIEQVKAILNRIISNQELAD